LALGASALWDPTDRTVQCARCPDHDHTLEQLKIENESSANRLAGVGGASARREYERRRTKRAEDVKRRHPKLGRLLLAVSDEPQSTKAWAQGAAGEQRVAQRLERELGDRAVVLNDRRLGRSRANIDHLVVGPAGVFTVDTKRYTGKVEQRRVGPLFSREVHLFVDRRDRTNLIDGVRTQAEAVSAALDAAFSVAAVLCFSGADWPMFSKPFVVSGVWIGWPQALAKSVVATSMLDREAIETIGERLDRAFPPA
jgi:hypothetical protein